MAEAPPGAERRYDPLLDAWVLVSPQRAARPWLGARGTPEPPGPSFDPACALCPGNTRASGIAMPAYEGVYSFANDFPALTAESAPEAGEELFRRAPARGAGRVLCFSPNHDLTLAEGDDALRRDVIALWRDELQRFGPEMAWVQLFENRGAMMGCSNPHPHGQLWASDFFPSLVAQELRSQQAYFERTGALLLAVVRDQEAEGPRAVLVTEGWVSWVPFWARWPYEVLLAPRRDLASLLVLTEDEQNDLARHLGLLLKAYDRHFACRTPYSFGWHGWHGLANAPPGLLLHAHLLPPLLNGPDRQKFMVGYELLAETQRDLTPEAAAAALRAALPPSP